MTATLILPDDIAARLHEVATLTGKNETACVIEALQEYLDDLEDLHIAEQRLSDIESGKTKTIPLAEVMKEYGLEY